MRPPCGRRGVARPSPSLWPLARPPVAAQRAGCRRAWDEGERIPARSRTPQPDRPERPRGATGREPRARRWRSGALPRWEERGLSGPVPLPPRALGSAPAGCAGWWGWSSAGIRSSSARRSRSSLVYTFFTQTLNLSVLASVSTRLLADVALQSSALLDRSDARVCQREARV